MENENLISDLNQVCTEVLAARKKFPTNAHLLAALTEEVGELAQAMLQKQGPLRIRAEAKQVACVALRIMGEGDSDFPQDSDQGMVEHDS